MPNIKLTTSYNFECQNDGMNVNALFPMSRSFATVKHLVKSSPLRHTISILLIILCCFRSVAQVTPGEDKVLNYRIVGFTFPDQGKVHQQLQIALGNCQTEASFEQAIFKKMSLSTNKVVVEVPSFGTAYTWRTLCTDKGKPQLRSPLHHFTIGSCPMVDTSHYRLRILKPASKYQDGYVFLDGSRVLYDMKGAPVWYLPDIYGGQSTVNDLKMTPQGTITFLLDGGAYEINYDGDILWHAPSIEGMDYLPGGQYNHQLTRLANGNYMVLGTETTFLTPKTSALDNGYIEADSHKKIQAADSLKNTLNATILEFNQEGQVVWSWRLSSYPRLHAAYYPQRPDGKSVYMMHQNAFFFDEKNQVVYLSLRIGSRILKINHTDGAVLADYGDEERPGSPKVKNSVFSGQHACNISADGDLYLFNNNVADSLKIPEILKFKEPKSGNGQLTKVWVYQCPVEDAALINASPRFFQTGGNVTELPDRSFFVSMPAQYSKLFIVGGDKRLIWEAVAEQWAPDDHAWRKYSQYRASMVCSAGDLGRLIWRRAPELSANF